jgi:hypothetical protein
MQYNCVYYCDTWVQLMIIDEIHLLGVDRGPVYTYTHMHINTYTYTHIHTCTYTHMHIYTYAHIHTCTYTQTHLRCMSCVMRPASCVMCHVSNFAFSHPCPPVPLSTPLHPCPYPHHHTIIPSYIIYTHTQEVIVSRMRFISTQTAKVCITIIDTITLTNYTNDAYIFDTYAAHTLRGPLHRPGEPP